MHSILKIAFALSVALLGIAPRPGVAADPVAGFAAPSRSDHFAVLQALAAQRGEVALIVRFDESGPPLPTLAPQAQQARTDAIQATRERLIADLAGWGRLANVKQFQFTPHVAFSADARVVGVLEHHPLALEVVEDELRAPTLEHTIPLVHADTGAWASGFTGFGQTVAILDSGVNKAHPFLAGKVVSEACYSTTNAAYGSTSLCPGGVESTLPGSGVDCSGISGCDHGTHVAGIAAGKDPGSAGRNGVAKDATLVAIQVFSRFDNATYCGSSTPCILSWSSDQMQALERVLVLRSAPNNVPVASANLSLGGGKYLSNCDGDALKPAIDNLRAVGTAVAIASGNNGYKNAISAPACISTAISVGSTCDSGNSYCAGVDAVASYSNIASFVSLLAPGSLVTSSVPGGGYASWHGTSMATPHVAGAWAVKRQQAPSASVSTILNDFRANGVTVNDTRTGGSVNGMKRIDFVSTTTYTLTVSHGGNGTVTSAPTGISCGANCAASFAAGTTATLTATPAGGYEFAGWAGACSGTGSCVVTMNANASVSAAFQAAVNDPPVAANDAWGGTAGSTLSVAAPGVLGNDSDPDGNALTAALLAAPANGSLTLAANGGFSYTPNAGFAGPDSFTYRAFDGALYGNMATVALTISQVTCTLPAVPTGLTAKALPKLRIQLAWTDAATNESGFRIERSTDGGSNWTSLASVGSNVTTYTDRNLNAGTTYRYRVRAYVGCGNSDPTNEATATARR